MTGVQTCALPICFPVTIKRWCGGVGGERDGKEKEKKIERREEERK